MEKTSREQEQHLKFLAKLIVANCVLNSSFGNTDCRRKMRDKKMKSVMEMTNKIYTFLKYSKDRDFLILMDMNYPENWSSPKLDKDFLKTMNLLGQIKNPS